MYNSVIEERAVGCLLGLACGDALGAPFEGAKPPVEPPLDFMPHHGLPAGSYTDDTQLTVITAEALLASGGLNADDLVSRFAAALDGLRGIGLTTRLVLEAVRAGAAWKDAARAAHARTGGMSAGNGAIMRAAPVAIRHYNNLPLLKQASIFQAAVIHHEPVAHEAAWLFNRVLAGLIAGAADREAVLGEVEAEMLAANPRLAGLMREAVTSTRRDLPPASGFVLHTLLNALWAFVSSDAAEPAIRLAVSLGGDTDTTAAVTGALAGAFYGAAALPAHWLDALENTARIRELAIGLYRAAATAQPADKGY